MTVWIFLAVIVAAFLSRSMSLLVSGVLFAFIQFTHQVWLGPYAETSGVVYGVAAMFADFMCVMVILCSSSMFDRNWHLIPFSIIIFASMANNLYGLTGWHGYATPGIANSNGKNIYIAVVILLIGSNFSGGIVRACRNFISRYSSFVRMLPRHIKGDS